MKKPDPNKTRPRLSKDLICRKAMELADADGIDALSMRKLAQALDCEAMSIYNHLKNKDEILSGLVELVAGEFHLPKVNRNWKGQMRKRAVRAHRVLMAHPWATQLMVSRVNTGPNMLAYVDATIGCLVDAGFSYPMADYGWNALDGFVYGFTLQQLNFPFEPEEYAQTAQDFMPELPPETLPHLRGLAMQVVNGKHDGVQDIGFGLDLLLNGLETNVAT